MKTIQLTTLISTLMFVLAFSMRAQADQISDTVADHQAMAAQYEEKAAVQDAVISEHTKMKEDYKAKYFINEKVSPMTKIREMEKHCDTIIAEASALKAGFLEFAKWHRMRAAELQGQ